MFDHKWFSGLAFGLVAGLFLAVFLSLIVSNGFPNWWRHTGTVVASEDTLAQWLMMCWSFLAVIVSGLAVYWVKRTFDVTRSMALDTREIGEAQASSYLSIGATRVVLSISNLNLSVSAEVKNSGASPALDVSGEIGFCLENSGKEVFSKEQQFYLGDIPSGGTIDLGGFFLTPIDAVSAQDWQLSEKSDIYIAARIYGYNVFGKEFVVRRCYMRVNLKLNEAARGADTVPMADPFDKRFIFGKFPTMEKEPRY